jgi:hypothetical protein
MRVRSSRVHSPGRQGSGQFHRTLDVKRLYSESRIRFSALIPLTLYNTRSDTIRSYAHLRSAGCNK